MKPSNTKKKKPRHTMIGVLMSEELVAALDAEAKAMDLDRSKVLRRALRQMLSRPS